VTEFLFASFNSYYTIAISIVVFLLFIELAGQLFGLSLTQLLDSSGDISVEASTLGGPQGGLDVLTWVGIKKLPAIIWLVSLLTIFAIVGYSVNYLVYIVLGGAIPKLLTGIVLFIAAVVFNAKVCGGLAKLLPREETSAVSKDSFSGLLAVITVGTAKQGQPAEAVIKDEFNQKHYVLVEPMDDEEFRQGDNVVLVMQESSKWLVTRFD
jgi:hypothetical protein